MWNWVIIMEVKLNIFFCDMHYLRAFRLLLVAKTGQSSYGDGQAFVPEIEIDTLGGFVSHHRTDEVRRAIVDKHWPF